MKIPVTLSQPASWLACLLSLTLLLGLASHAQAQNYPMNNNNPVTTCSGTFYDSGGANGNYASNENFTKTFSPATAGAKVRLSFTSFNVEDSGFFGTIYDAMYIYDGPTATGTPIGTYYGTNSPGVVTATNGTGQLTVRFISDDTVTPSGWAATISCVTYYPISNTATTTTCAGIFTDSNISGNYANNETFTKVFSPATAGAAVQLAFTSFDTEDGFDYLYIYDGPTTSAPLIGQYSGTTLPGTITASNATGQLTARFTSDFSRTRDGWEADIACVNPLTFTPASGSPGTSVLITGGQLGTVTGVTFNGTAAFFFYNSATGQIRASVPTGASTGPIRLVRATAATSISSTSNFLVCATVATASNYAADLSATNTATATPANVGAGSSATCGTPSLYFLDGAELLVNGTFTGNANGWTPAFINTDNVAGAGGYIATGGNPDGMYDLNDNGNNANDPSISQTVSGLTAGATYLVQGDYRDYSQIQNSQAAPVFSVDINGTSVLTRTNPGAIWTHFAYVLTVPAGQTTRTFTFRAEINGTDVDIAVDNLSLRRLTTTQAYTCANTGPNAVTLLAYNPSTGDVSTSAGTVTVAPPAVAATATTWNGSASANPQDCANWSYGKVPTATTSVTIPSGTPTLNLASGTLSAASLTIASGSSLTVGTGATLQVSGDFTNNGVATLPGTVQFVGSTATQTVGGTAATTFTTLTVNKAAGTVQLARDITVASALTLSSGTLTTGATVAATGFKVVLAPTATITESDVSYVIGAVETTRNLNAAGTTTTFGGLGLSLTPSGAVLPGSTLVRRVTGSPVTGVNSRQGIGRYFTFAPTVNAGLNVNMTFDYFDHERNGIADANLTLFRTLSAAASTADWMRQATSTRSGNTVSRPALTTLAGTFTLGSLAAPLPVELSAFTATAEGTTAVRLAWATASEKNSARFEVERSPDGHTFAAIGTVAAAGTTSTPRSYELLDAKLPAAALLYYRLKQVDADGTFSYSPVRSVALAGAVAEALSLYPNPAHGATTLTGALPGVVVTMVDALGRPVASATADEAGTAALVLPAGTAAGVYVVRAGRQALRLTVE